MALPEVDLPTAFYTRFWLWWALGAVATPFAIVETLALLDDDINDTLSEHAGPIIQGHMAVWLVFTVFMVWLWVHWAIQRHG